MYKSPCEGDVGSEVSAGVHCTAEDCNGWLSDLQTAASLLLRTDMAIIPKPVRFSIFMRGHKR